MSLTVDASDKEHLFIGSSGAGMLEFRNNQVVAHYDTANSTLLSQVGNPTQYKVHGLSYDREGNVWVSNAGTAAVIQVLKSDRTWKRFFFPGAVNSTAITGDMIIDDFGSVWVSAFQNLGGKEGILVFNPNNTIDNTADDKYEIVDFALNRVRCLAKDLDGTIWAGTEAGVYVFYPPSTLPQQILIKQNNTFQYLLSSEIVTAIAVDGANRKWVGTENGGLFLFSPDGQEQILHFTSSNSPLFSDNITALAIDGKSGEVYIGTDKGLLSYRSDAITPEQDVLGCKDLLVYPNPVRSEYAGPVAIRGLVPNGTVRITDIHGGLVFQTTALGTQAVWNGTNNTDKRVPTGVYVVYSTDEAGEFSCVTKVMVYR
jgi:ligand-binding sensor domain-containing protein